MDENEIVRNFATIGEIYEDGVSLIFDGEEEPTEKHYLCNTSVIFHAGDRVRIVSESGTYIVEYIVGAPKIGESIEGGLPTGGTAGQILVKSSSDDFAAFWDDPRFVPASGTTGYLLTKTSTGYAWQSASLVPSGGSTGQILTKTASGYAWQDMPSSGIPTTGTTGYVLTKTSGGFAWQPPPTEIPTTGTTGYVLTKTSGGFAWQALPSDGIPTSGTTGHILTKTATGFGWAAAPHELPTGGTAGQVLVKDTTTNYDVSWSTPKVNSVENLVDNRDNYRIQFRTTSTSAVNTVFQIRMGTNAWKTITVT